MFIGLGYSKSHLNEGAWLARIQQIKTSHMVLVNNTLDAHEQIFMLGWSVIQATHAIFSLVKSIKILIFLVSNAAYSSK
jgi:hypothetical protein